MRLRSSPRRCSPRLTLAFGAPSSSQNASDLAKEMIGEWELSTAGRDRTCAVTLKNDNAPGGKKLELEKSCAEALPFTKDIDRLVDQGPGDIVRLQDGKGEALLDFTEVENGIFEGLRQGEGVFILQNLAAARALNRSTDQMIGDWAVVRGGGKTICAITLTNNDAGNESFQVFVKPRCDALIRQFCADDLAHRARRIAADLRQARDLAVRGRRQCAVAARAGYRRSVPAGADNNNSGASHGLSRPLRPAAFDLLRGCRASLSRRRRPDVFGLAGCGRGAGCGDCRRSGFRAGAYCAAPAITSSMRT